jgi:hypothetical protein
MPDIQFTCPSCSQSLAVDEAGAGMVLQCPACGKDVTAPRLSSAIHPAIRHGFGFQAAAQKPTNSASNAATGATSRQKATHKKKRGWLSNLLLYIAVLVCTILFCWLSDAIRGCSSSSIGQSQAGNEGYSSGLIIVIVIISVAVLFFIAQGIVAIGAVSRLPDKNLSPTIIGIAVVVCITVAVVVWVLWLILEGS